MYVRILNGFLTDEFMAGVEQFVEFCQSMPYFESEIRKYGVHARGAGIEGSYTLMSLGRTCIVVVLFLIITSGFVKGRQTLCIKGLCKSLYGSKAVVVTMSPFINYVNQIMVRYTKWYLMWQVSSVFPNAEDASNFLEEDPYP